ncbi:peptidoglycan-binding protein [Shimia sp. W99]
MRTTSTWIITGLALSISMGAQASVLTPSVPIQGAPAASLLWDAQVGAAQHRTPEARARDEEAELGLSYSDRRQIQSDLKVLGYDPGPVDGSFGRLTRRAIWDWQFSMDHWPSGYLTRDQVRQMRAAARDKRPEQRYSEVEDRRYWETTGAKWGSRDGMRAYLKRYPNGVYASYARDQLGQGDRDGRRRDDAAWREASDQNTVRAYRAYLERFPDGRYVDQARVRIRDLTVGRDEVAWREAGSQNTVNAYRAYLDRFPNGRYASDARMRIREMTAGQEAAAWRDASNRDTPHAYRAYLDRYPNGRYATQARARIRELTSGREEAAWDEARNLNTVNGYWSYLDRFPQGRYASEAKSRIRQLTSDQEETRWRAARRQDTIEAYRDFLQRYPQSRMAPEARNRIAELRGSNEDRQQAERRVWLAAKQENTISGYRNYLRQYPNGRFAREAKAGIKALENRRPEPTPGDAQALERSIIKTDRDMYNLLEGLRRLGYLKSNTATTITPEVREAIRRMQRKIKRPMTGYVDEHVWSVIATVINNR